MLAKRSFSPTMASARSRDIIASIPMASSGTNDVLRSVSAGRITRALWRNSNYAGGVDACELLIIVVAQKFHHYYVRFKVECPTGSGRYHSSTRCDELRRD